MFNCSKLHFISRSFSGKNISLPLFYIKSNVTVFILCGYTKIYKCHIEKYGERTYIFYKAQFFRGKVYYIFLQELWLSLFFTYGIYDIIEISMTQNNEQGKLNNQHYRFMKWTLSSLSACLFYHLYLTRSDRDDSKKPKPLHKLH